MPNPNADDHAAAIDAIIDTAAPDTATAREPVSRELTGAEAATMAERPGAPIPEGEAGTARTDAAAADAAEQRVPYARFKEVNEALKAYRETGLTPDQVRAARAYFEQQSAAEERAQRTRTPTADEEREARLTTSMLDVFQRALSDPRYADHPLVREFAENRIVRAREYDRTDREAVDYFVAKMRDLPFLAHADPEAIGDYTAMATGIINRDPAMQRQFHSLPEMRTALDTAFDRWKSRAIDPVLKYAGLSTDAAKLIEHDRKRQALAARNTPASAASAVRHDYAPPKDLKPNTAAYDRYLAESYSREIADILASAEDTTA